MRIVTSFFLFLFFFTAGNAQVCFETFNPKKQLVATTMLCPSAMQEDLEQLHKHILNTHPNPTYYGELNDLSTAYQNALSKINKPLSVFEFLVVVNAYLNVLKDSHTGINPKQFLYGVNFKRKVLPFSVAQIDHKFFVKSAIDPAFTIGAELIDIDQYKVTELFEYGKMLSLTEGQADEATHEIAGEYISVAYNLLSMSMSETKTAQVKMVKVEGDTVQREIAFLSSWKYFLDSYFIDSDPIVSYSFDGQNNALLTINSFEPLSLNHFKKELDAFFKEVKLRNCPVLYIDLRNNLGGLLRAEEYLFSYINTKDTPIQTNYLYKRSDYDRFAMLSPFQQIQFVNRAKHYYPEGLISKEYDFYKLPKGATCTILYDYIPKNNLNYVYNGDCKLVLNANSMSASVLFAGWFKFINRGEILGATCMGGIGGTFGNPAVITLHHTRIEVMVSTLKFTPLHIHERILAPIVPDVPLKASRQDLIEKRDPFLEYLKNHHQ